MTARYYVAIEVGPDLWLPLCVADSAGIEGYTAAQERRMHLYQHPPVEPRYFQAGTPRTKLLLDLTSVLVEDEAQLRELLAQDPVLNAIFKTGVRQGVLQEQRRLRANLHDSVVPE